MAQTLRSSAKVGLAVVHCQLVCADELVLRDRLVKTAPQEVVDIARTPMQQSDPIAGRSLGEHKRQRQRGNEQDEGGDQRDQVAAGASFERTLTLGLQHLGLSHRRGSA